MSDYSVALVVVAVSVAVAVLSNVFSEVGGKDVSRVFSLDLGTFERCSGDLCQQRFATQGDMGMGSEVLLYFFHKYLSSTYSLHTPGP